jgi:hypothetical protein
MNSNTKKSKNPESIFFLDFLIQNSVEFTFFKENMLKNKKILIQTEFEFKNPKII